LAQWGDKSSYNSTAWNKACHKDNDCLITPEDYYRIFYLKVKNGFPSELVNVDSNYSLEIPFNTLLQRTWIHPEYYDHGTEKYDLHPDFWNQCRSKAYFATYAQKGSFETFHIKLSTGQEIRLENTMYSVLLTSGKESKKVYHNISDSWIDVALWLHVDEGLMGEGEHAYETWRVYGNTPDPWDAPSIIKNHYGNWPPISILESENYYLKICEHLTSHPHGSIQYDTVESIDDIHTSGSPIETSIVPFKGTLSGYLYEGPLELNEIAFDIVSTSFKNFRIERYDTYFTFYLSYGDGEPSWSSEFLDYITDQNKWDSKVYGITFNLLLDGSIEIISQISNYEFPFEENDQIIFDNNLDINRLGTKGFSETNIENLLSPAGIIEYQRIYDEIIADWVAEGWNIENIDSQICPLVAKQV
jgi:hypothetical protein